MAGSELAREESDSRRIDHLTLAIVAESESAPQNDISQLKILSLPNKGISSCDDLSQLKSLQRIDLPSNELTEADFLQYNLELCWIDLRMNQIHQLSFLKYLRALTVLNLSHNQISKIDNLSGLMNLKALILSHNQIRNIPDLSFLTNLETLVVSHNQVEEIIRPQKTMKQLKKISLSNNQIRNFPFGEKFPELAELRLNSNKLMTLPSNKIQQMSMLRILDIGNNAINDIKIFSSLQNLLKLRNINIAGNLSAEDMAIVFSQFSTHKTLEIFNSKNIKDVPPSRKRKRNVPSVTVLKKH